MKEATSAAAIGALFALGLVISGMLEPARITAFLDVTRGWDPTLMFVMGGAIAVHMPLVRLVRAREAVGRMPRLEGRVHWPTQHGIDAQLVGGAAIFGVGWGLSGYCPGPAVASIVAGGLPVIVFVATLLAGLAIAHLLSRSTHGTPPRG